MEPQTLPAEDPGKRLPLVEGHHDLASITEVISKPTETSLLRTPPWWLIGFTGCFSIFMIYQGLIGYLLYEGTGIWGVNNPVGWGFAIINMVFWVGIGHAGTLISAILFLFRQRWRTAINRFSEAMTLFAVMCALVFPGIHVGRAWVAPLFMAPIPNQMSLWPNFRSPLLWDLFAFSTYFTVSFLFWYVGLIPDLATLRDRTTNKLRKIIFGVLALGWRGAHRHWINYERAYLILAALATPLVLSVHSIVSFDFAVSQVPGWHTTIFPPYFVAGAIFSGFGMVVTLMVLARSLFGLKEIMTLNHLENMNKILMATGLMVGYAYGMEFFVAWYSGNPYETFTFINRAFGPYAWAYWIMITCNVFIPQLFWSRKLRRNIPVMFVISIFVNVGMWFERFVIVVTSLHRDFLPSSWGYYIPTKYDFGFLIGSFGMFMTLFLLFLRFLPMVSIAEIKGVMPQSKPHPEGGH